MKLALRNRAVRYSALTLAVLALVSSPRTVSAQNTWTGLTDANWSIAGNWSGGSVPISTDNVVFATPVPGTGAAITLGSGSVANSVWIQDDYTFTGGDLALGSGAIRVNLGQAFVLNSQLSGTAGLTKTGGGSLRLTNALNDFTGSILIANGSLVITDPSQLGASTSAIVVTESNTTVGSTTLYGFVGGSLVLDGTAGAITLSRDLLLQGGGPINPRSGAVRSFGDNTISGLVTMAAGTPTARNTRVISNNGTLTLSGGLHVAGTPGTTISTLGGVNTTGAGGNYLLTGPLTGTGTLEKAGAGTLFLNPSATSGFSGRIRVGASVTSGQSSVRISSANVFGTANEEGTNAPIDMRGGILEVRSDNSLNIGKNVYLYESSTFFAGPAVGGEAVSGTVTYGGLHARVSRTATFNSRNGYGMTFSVQTMAASTSTGNSTFNNNMGGLLTVNGNVWDNNDALNRTLAFGGNGNTIIGGSINSGGTGVKTLTKTGSGSLTIMGTETTLNGPVNIQGAIAITDFRSLNNNTGTINLGSTGSTAGALIIGTAQASTGAGLATGKVLNLNGTTATASVYANQAGTNPVMLNSNFTVTGTGAKTLNLGGVNTADNVINGSIMDGGVTGATTTAASFAAGATSISLRSVTGLTVGDAISGTGIAAGTTVTEIDPVTRVVTLSQATSAAGSSNQTINSAALVGPTALTKIGSGTWVLAGANTYTGTTTIANGTLKLKANAATSTVLPSTGAVTFNNSNGFAGATLELVGRDGENNVQQLGLLAYSAGANTLKLTPGTGGTASLAFSRINTTGGSTLNIVGADFTDNTVTLTQVNTGIGSDGIITRSIYWEGADFAYREGGVLRAPVYGEDASTSTTASGSLISGRHNEITGSLSTNTVSVVTLKIAGSHTLSLNSGHTLTLSAGGLLTTGGNALVTGGTLALGSQALVTRVNLETDVLTIESAVTGTGGLTKSGLGTLVLAGVSTRTGTTNINEGTVQLSGSGMLSGNNVTTNIRQNAILDLNGVSTGTSIGQFNNAGVVTNSSAADVVLSIGNGVTTNGTAGTSFGIIEDGAGGGKTSLIIATSNNNSTNTTTYILNGLSTFTGSTTLTKTTVGNLVVQANTLANIGSDSSIGRGDATSDATNAASLVFSGLGGELRYIGGILEGNLTLGSQSASTNRLFTLAGTGATLSSTATNNNAIVWSNTGAIVHSGEAARTVILTGTSTGDNTFNPQLTDSGTGANITSVSKTGAGQWNLGNANNTYTGATTINEGILALNDNGALPTNSSLVLRPTSATSAAIVQMSGVFDRNISDTPTAGIGTITWAGTTASTTGGAGFAAHTTELIVAIGGVASPTALTWGSGGFVGTSSVQNLVLNSTTALSSVDFRNDIDLGNAQRTVNVLDNTQTGADFAVMSGVLSGTGGSLRKIGSGALKVTGANTYTGATAVNAGVLAVTSLGNSAAPGASSVGDSTNANTNASAVTLGNGGTGGANLQYLGAGETSDRKIRLNSTTGSNYINADGVGALVLTNVANDMLAGAKILYLRGTNTDGNMITSQLSDNGGALRITVDSSATWILTNSANDYTGITSSSAGALGIGHNNALGNSTLVMSGGTVFAHGADRTISNTANLNNDGTQAFIGDHNLTFGSGLTLLAAANNVTTVNGISAGKSLILKGVTANELTGTRTWTIDGSGETIIDGDITSTTTNGLNIAKSGTGTLVLKGAKQISTGYTYVNNGTLRLDVANALPAGTTLRLGTGSNAGTLHLNGVNQTVGSLLSQTNSTTAVNNLIITPGNTMTVTGAVTIGTNTSNSTTLFAATGGGAFVNRNSGGTFQVGGATSSNVNAVTADFSGLASFTVDLGATGMVRIGDNSSLTSGTTATSTLILAENNVITAGLLQVSPTQPQALQTLRLGSNTNQLNVNTLSVGSNHRGSGIIDFASGTGSVVLRAADGTGRAEVRLAAHTESTNANNNNTVDLTGHDADLLISTLTLVDRTGSGSPGGPDNQGAGIASFSFDQGTLDVTALVMARRTGSGSGDGIATLNLGGGTAVIGATTMAVNTSAGGNVVANLNISGGNVTIGTGSGTAINMANAGSGRTVTSNINLTAGALTAVGNIIRTGGTGTENAAIMLDGGSLNMGGNSIGSSAAQIALNAQSGTLANLGELNGGGTLTKTTAGTLVLSGANTYTGATTVNAGTLLVHGTHTGGGAYTVAGGTLGGTGSIGSVVNVNAGGRLAPGASVGTLAIGGNLSLAGGSVFEWEFNSSTLAADLLNLNGQLNLDLAGGVSLELVDLAGSASAVPYGTKYTLASYSGDWNGGLFDDLANNGKFVSGLNEWQIRYDDVTAGVNGGLYSAFVTLTVIPEPTSVILLLGAIMGLLLSRRRRG